MPIKYMVMLFLAGMSVVASAHMLPKGRATLNLKGEKGYLVVSVAASALVGADDNDDGLLGPAEIERSRLQIQKQFSDGFLISFAGKNVPLAFVWITHPDNGEAEQAPSDYIIVLAGVEFPKPPETITVKNILYGTGIDEKQTVLTVTRGREKQEVMLDAQQPSHEFFSSRFAGGNYGVWVGIITLVVTTALIFGLRRHRRKRESYTG